MTKDIFEAQIINEDELATVNGGSWLTDWIPTSATKAIVNAGLNVIPTAAVANGALAMHGQPSLADMIIRD